MNAHVSRRTLVSAIGGLLAFFAADCAQPQTANFPSGAPKLPSWSELPDWTGLWERGGDITWDDSLPFKPGEPPVPPYNDGFMKEYQARRAEMRQAAAAGAPRNLRGGNLYGGMPAIMIALWPLGLVINPREVVITSANGGIREIYTDGRAHPLDPLPGAKGHSIGHWEGKVLIVDTCCFKENTRLPGGGTHSDAMHITERFWAPDDHTLKDAIVVEDPKAFTKPWTTEKTYYKRPDWEQVEHDAEENTRDFGRPNENDSAHFAAAPPPPTKAIERKPGKPLTDTDTEAFQKATARAIGNTAWETVHVSEVQIGGSEIKWLGATRSANWRCTAAPDGSKAYCEQ